MSGYTVFLGPITGIIITDVSSHTPFIHPPLSFAKGFESNCGLDQYWLVHRTHVDVPSMYRPHGRYRYTYGAVSLPEIDRMFCPSQRV